MSRHFIIDGYNALHSASWLNHVPRDLQRQQFLRFLDETPPTRSERNSVTVVLDGYAAPLKGTRYGTIRVIFSEDRDADSVIKQRVSDMANPQDAVVVTNDRALHEAVRVAGAKVMACEDFFLLQKKQPVSKKTPKVDFAMAEAINNELKSVWKLK